jgi:hypothetical protein
MISMSLYEAPKPKIFHVRSGIPTDIHDQLKLDNKYVR